MARSAEALANNVLTGDRAALARAITLVESSKDTDRRTAGEVIRRLMHATGDGHRIGISGPPGVGKSTLIDAYGMFLGEQGRRVAVLAVDPSSSLSGGSILGDKSRMSTLAQHPDAFIRPSPSDLELGGVTRRTREAMFLCEGAGFDRVLIETVGVGQSEIQVAGMVDTFIVLIQPGAGDELQGIKKGILELADVLVVTKADGDNTGPAREAVAEYSAALRYLDTKAEIVALSARTGEGIARLGELADEHRATTSASGALSRRRTADAARWISELAEQTLLRRWHRRTIDPEELASLARGVLSGELEAEAVALELLAR